MGKYIFVTFPIYIHHIFPKIPTNNAPYSILMTNKDVAEYSKLSAKQKSDAVYRAICSNDAPILYPGNN